MYKFAQPFLRNQHVLTVQITDNCAAGQFLCFLQILSAQPGLHQVWSKIGASRLSTPSWCQSSKSDKMSLNTKHARFVKTHTFVRTISNFRAKTLRFIGKDARSILLISTKMSAIFFFFSFF